MGVTSDGTEPAPIDHDRELRSDRGRDRDDADGPDLDRLATEIADVEHALERLDDGSYWTDEVTGEPIGDDVLAADPTARRAAYATVRPASAASPAPAGAEPASDAADARSDVGQGETPPTA